MLKKLSLLVAIVMLVSLLVPALSAVADDAEEANFVRFTALGNDPYATFKFSAAGKNATIDPDKVVWAAIRYRTISQFDTTGVEYKAQFYVSPAAEPYVPITYKHTQKWETAIVDLTAVAESTDLDSKWNSDSYTTLTSVRFDPLEPDRDSENTEHDGESGQVAEGDAIDVAWIAFFEKEDDAKAYTGKEDTPYCILDIDSLGGIAGGNNIKADKFFNGEPEATPEPTEKPYKDEYTLYTGKPNASTGWWLNPVNEGDTITVGFEAPDWFNGIKYFSFCAEHETPMVIRVLNDNEDEVTSKETSCISNAAYEVMFDTKMAPGWYYIVFEGGDTSELGQSWFVLGSADGDEDVEVEIEGGATNGDTKTHPYITLLICEPGEATPEPEVTEEPTAEQTAEPTATPEPEPTEAPEPTAAPTEEPKPAKKGCKGFVEGGVFAVCAIAGALFVIRKKDN